jgi:hypothetical protein
MYASIEFMSGELQNARMLLRCCCATAVPIFPGEAPITAEGLRVNAFLPYGRLAPVDGILQPARELNGCTRE